MIEIIAVRFKSGGKQYYFDPKGLKVSADQGVIVETARGHEMALCTRGNHEIPKDGAPPLRPVIRLATPQDMAMVEKNRQREQWAKKICMEKITAHKLEMKLVGVEYSFEGNKVLFFFTADGRVDFRNLVKDLASTIHARIELRQIGVRDEAKMVGGLGICGRPFCCNQFLDKFQPVSIKMAKTQNLSLNPTKISGTCGRLMCCLKYEQEAYKELLKTTPRSDSFVETPDGAGTITSVNLLRQLVDVRLESSPDVPKKYHNCEIVVVRSGKGRRPEGYVQPPLSQLEKQRKIVENSAPSTVEKTGLNPLATALEAMLNPVENPVEKAKGRPQDRGQDRPSNRSGNGSRPPKNPNQNPKNSKQRDGKNRPPQKSGGKPPFKNGGKPKQGQGAGGKPNRPPRKKPYPNQGDGESS